MEYAFQGLDGIMLACFNLGGMEFSDDEDNCSGKSQEYMYIDPNHFGCVEDPVKLEGKYKFSTFILNAKRIKSY